MTAQAVKYVLDANVFMEASRRYYPFDFAKPFWDGLLYYSEMKIVCSVDKVLDEINKGNDELKTWANNEYIDYFIPTKNEDILTAYSTIVIWAQGQDQYTQLAKDTFMKAENADTWVLAFALSNELAVVTHEVLDNHIRKRIPIPNVCNAFNIKPCDTFEMLRNLNFSF
ncbi:DUF4411 family protein [candidate division KSB1 bacterium]|nr:DUF4411 family protein [candidate division KSB1 bacterium]